MWETKNITEYNINNSYDNSRNSSIDKSEHGEYEN